MPSISQHLCRLQRLCKQVSIGKPLGTSSSNAANKESSCRSCKPPILCASLVLCRQARHRGEIRSGERDSHDPITDLSGHAVKYPENLGFNNLLYFLAAPTLVYQIAYPRSARFRVRWLVK